MELGQSSTTRHKGAWKIFWSSLSDPSLVHKALNDNDILVTLDLVLRRLHTAPWGRGAGTDDTIHTTNINNRACKNNFIGPYFTNRSIPTYYCEVQAVSAPMIDSLSPNVCYDVTKPVFKRLQKTTSPKNHATSRPEFVWVGGSWQLLRSLSHYFRSVRILGESIKYPYLKMFYICVLIVLEVRRAICVPSNSYRGLVACSPLEGGWSQMTQHNHKPTTTGPTKHNKARFWQPLPQIIVQYFLI